MDGGLEDAWVSRGLRKRKPGEGGGEDHGLVTMDEIRFYATLSTTSWFPDERTWHAGSYYFDFFHIFRNSTRRYQGVMEDLHLWPSDRVDR